MAGPVPGTDYTLMRSNAVTERITPTELARRTGEMLHKVAQGMTLEVVTGRYGDPVATISPPQPDREAASDKR